jgi:hypothetical protein
MRGYVGARDRWRPEATAVLQVAACGLGTPRWWRSDGPLIPLRFHPRLVALAARVAEEEPHLRALPRRGRGPGAAWRARSAGWPAIVIGCREDDAWPRGARQPTDAADRLDPDAMRAALEFGLALVAALDADLATAEPTGQT